MRESGIAFALPTYAFVAAMYVARRHWSLEVRDRRLPHAHVADPIAAGAGDRDGLLLVRAFATVPLR